MRNMSIGTLVGSTLTTIAIDLGPIIGSSIVLAQAAITLDPSVSSLVGNGVTIIVLAWYVVYDVRVRTPEMMRAFKEEQRATRDLFSEEAKANRDLSLVQGREMREFYDKQIALALKLVQNSSQDMRVAVHDVKEVAHETFLGVKADKAELEDLKKRIDQKLTAIGDA